MWGASLFSAVPNGPHKQQLIGRQDVEIDPFRRLNLVFARISSSCAVLVNI